MSENRLFIAFTLIVALFLSNSAKAQSSKVDTKAPTFKVKSGEDEELSLEQIKGKVIVIFYETKDIVEKNRRLKDELKAFYDALPDTLKKYIVRLPVINCKGAFWPFTGKWKKKLRENSKKEGITIYGDWTGKMFSDYKIKDKESNVIILDKQGIIKYFRARKIEDEEIDKTKEILTELTISAISAFGEHK